jgi:LacI family transcriptional regulator
VRKRLRGRYHVRFVTRKRLHDYCCAPVRILRFTRKGAGVRARSVTIADVARAARVHPSTVSRILRGQAGTEATVFRVKEAAAVLGYRPNASARNLALAKTMTIGLLLPDLGNLMYVGFARGVQDEARSAGYSVVICDGRHDPAIIRDEIERFLTLRVDGVVVSRAFARMDLLQPLTDEAVPVEPLELLRGELPASGERRAGSMAAFRRMFGLGHRSVAMFIHRRADAPSYSQEMEARISALNSSRAQSAPDARARLVAVESAAECAEELRALMESPDPPTALIAGNDWMTAPLLEATTTCQLLIPDDVSVLAYGDSPWAAAYRPAISVIRYDYYREGRILAGRILERLSGAEVQPPPLQLASEEYVERRSLGRAVGPQGSDHAAARE